jgi:teichuronic acid biosynthesis glycosyltransferase TuaC
MRVAVVAEWYPGPADPVHGIWAHRQAVAAAAQGAEIQVLALRRPVPPLSVARRLARVPPDVGALSGWARDLPAQLAVARRDGLTVHAVPWLGPPRPLSYGMWGWFMAPSLGVALDRLEAAWPFDVLHAHCLAPAGHAAALWVASRRGRDRGPGSRGAAGPAFVVSGHGGDLYGLPDNTPFGRRAVHVTLGAADLALANSSWAQRRIAQLAPGPVACEVVHLGADVVGAPAGGEADAGREPGPEPDAEAGVGAQRLRIITVAHLQERKHHHVVLAALARLDPDVRPDYLIVGDGEQRTALEGLVEQLGIGERVRFAGQLPNDEAVARMGDSDLFVMPSVEEPFGVAFVEAMGAGVPAVAARGQGGPEDIAAAGGGMLLVDPDDPAELADVLARLAADHAELAALGAAARETVRAHFTWERCGAATVAAYERAVSLARAGGGR